MKIAFVHCVDPHYARTQMFGIHYMPVWAFTLASHLEQIPGLEISLFDTRIRPKEFIVESDLFLFSGINQDCQAILELHRELRERFPKSLSLIGGPICWSFFQAGQLDRLKDFDHICIGEGEEFLVQLVKDLQNGRKPSRIQESQKFNLSRALPMSKKLMGQFLGYYYGGIIEVSRGCPFLCEFCDIRVLPDNNRVNNKSVDVIMEDLDFFAKRDVKQILFACDNFVGQPAWTEKVCDRIIEWKEKTGLSISLYTWLTIDVANHPRLLRKLRLAGFDMFFIGVESFHRNSLLETAKVQNLKTSGSLLEALRTIQSFGIIVVAGIIFGFDTDPEDIVQRTLDGILKSGLISGDPTLLTALPGTPLYKRMQFADRLRKGKLGLGGFKYRTNILYVTPEQKIKNNFRIFVKKLNRGRYQYRRFKAFLSTLMNSTNYTSVKTGNYIDLKRLFRLTFRNPGYFLLFLKRMGMLVASPERTYYLVRATMDVLFHSSKKRPLWSYYNFWVFNWTNSILKYSNLKEEDFDIAGIEGKVSKESILPEKYLDLSLSDEPIPMEKIRAQRRYTVEALKNLVQASPLLH